jgi:phosphoribosylformylglycinamidine cyclo-ligase
MSKKKKLTYADAGVNIDAMSDALGKIEQDVRSTFNKNVIENVGGFGTLYKPSFEDMEEPVLISSTDSVGTKVRVAIMAGIYDTVGQDIVNHCVNDILVQGAAPLYFLDYVGTGILKPEFMEQIIAGLAKACRENSMVLIGGETAEMPGMYQKGDFDLVGCIVGMADRKKILTGDTIQEGDAVIGFPSTGLHTNGYSLARKVFFEIKGFEAGTQVDELGCTVGEELLKIHKSYFNVIYPHIETWGIKGLAHITGGGFLDNIPRILPQGTAVRIEADSWEVLPVFSYIQREGNVEDLEMFRAFNMGIGMIAVVPPEKADVIVEEAAGGQLSQTGNPCEYSLPDKGNRGCPHEQQHQY